MLLIGIVDMRNGSSKLKRYEAQFINVFDTVTQIIGYAESEEEFAAQVSMLKEQFEYYNRLYDIYHTYEGMNNAASINAQAGVEPVQVEEELLALIQWGKKMYEDTDGKVNIAYGSVLKIWHDYREKGLTDPGKAEVPPKEMLDAAAVHTKIENVIVDEAASTVYLEDGQMSLDLGSIGKGYAVQKVAEYARAQGMEHLLISAGGNVCTIGTKPDGSDWSVGVQNPDTKSSNTYLETLSLSDHSAVTSGNYQRYYEVDGKRYCHIIDPDTNMPAEYVDSVTIIAKDSGLADALSTAVFNMEYEQGKKLVEGMPQVEAVWIFADETKAYSSKASEYIAK